MHPQYEVDFQQGKPRVRDIRANHRKDRAGRLHEPNIDRLHKHTNVQQIRRVPNIEEGAIQRAEQHQRVPEGGVQFQEGRLKHRPVHLHAAVAEQKKTKMSNLTIPIDNLSLK